MSDLEKEECPICKKQHMVRKKRLLIDEAWTIAPGKDPRLKYFADLRVDDLKYSSPSPLEQFIEGFYCDHCGKGFVSETVLKAGHKVYK